MNKFYHQFVNTNTFNQISLYVVLFNSLLIGLSTYFIDNPAIIYMEHLCVGFFIFELVFRWVGKKDVKSFFKDGWNIFDIIIIISTFIPNVGAYSSIFRVLRALRIFKICNKYKELDMIIKVLIKSVCSLAYISILMAIFFYVYSIIGFELFKNIQPDQFGTLHESCFTLFQSITGDDWGNLRNDAIEKGGNYYIVTIYHLSWMIVGVFLLLNLLLGAVMNNYEEVRKETEVETIMADGLTLDEEIYIASQKLNALMKKKFDE